MRRARAGDGNLPQTFDQLQIPFTLELPGRPPQTLPEGASPVLPQREAACFSRGGAAVFVASEQRGAAAAWPVRFDRR